MKRAPILGTSACIFRADHVLLIERGRPPFLGLFSLPGGRIEFGERIEDAIRREVLEETNLAIDRFSFFCLHEAIDEEAHVVIAVHRASEALRPGIEPQAGDDAKSLRFVPIHDLARMEGAGMLTSGLRAIVESAHRTHLLGL